MTLYAPLWQQNDSYAAKTDRQLIDMLVAAGGGVVGATDLKVTQRGAGANMSVDVAAGKCFIAGTQISLQGKYGCVSDAITNVTIATAPGTGLSRIDKIVATVRDATAIGGSNNDWIIQAVTGTAASSPAAPATPASSILLAQVRVGANVTTIPTTKITDERPYAVMGTGLRGILIGAAGTTYGAAPAVGVGPFFIQASSTVLTTNSASNFSISYPVPFPNGVLTVVACWGTNTNVGGLLYVLETASKTGFNGYAAATPTKGVRINWFAIGF